MEQCKKISVDIHTEKGGCCLDHLHVKHQNAVYDLQVETRFLVELTNLTKVDCKNFPSFVWIHDNIYVANKEEGTSVLNITSPKHHVTSHEIFRDKNYEDLYEL